MPYVQNATSVASLFIGNVINLFLYGALTVQLYLYYTSFPNDSRPQKMTVYLIYAAETIYTVLLTYDLGRFVLSTVPPASQWTISIIAIPIGGGIVAFLTQATYAHRIRRIFQFNKFAWCIVALIAANLVAIIVLAPFQALPFESVLVWATVSLATDTTIAGIMIWGLTSSNIKDMASEKLKSRLTRLIHLVIGTGALTAAINLVTLILIARKSANVCGPGIVLSKLYANSTMVLLNDRRLSGDCGGQQMSLETITTGEPGSLHVASRVPGFAHTLAQGQLDLEGRGDAKASISTAEDASVRVKQDGCPA